MSPRSKEIPLRLGRERAGLSLRKAAQHLGVTHAYLSALEHGRKPLREDRRNQLAALYSIGDPEMLVQPLPQNTDEFIRWLREQIKWWDSRFVLPTMPAITSLVADLYVEPSFMADEGGLDQDELLDELFNDPTNRAVLLMGHIGTGKSFFLRMLTLDLDRIMSRLEVTEQYVPILVSLGQFRLRPGSFVGSLVDYYLTSGFSAAGPQLERFFRECFERGKALLLFDGLDELFDSAHRVETLARLQHCFEDQIRPQGSRMIVSGRRAAFLERDRRYDGFRAVEIAEWHPVQMYQASVKWSWERRQQAATFWALLQANDVLFDLAKLPLIFHLLATLYSTSGTKAFQELSALCDACCQVLEDSWYTARRVMPGIREESPQPESDQIPTWVKWRHFLIHLMDQVLESWEQNEKPLKLTFSPGEMQEAWELFLTTKGVERASLDFSRLAALIDNQKRIGPVIHSRRVLRSEESTAVWEEFHFLEPIFGHYYLAKALINKPQGLSEFVICNLRKEAWEKVIPLAIQELGRSERRYENDLGRELIETVLVCDDTLELERRHRVGHFGLFTAMRGIATYNFNRYWDSVIEPSLQVYMTSNYESDVSSAFEILGEYSASDKIRSYFIEKHDALSEGPDSTLPMSDSKWRVLCAMAKLGERTDFIFDELENGIEQFTSWETWQAPEGRLHARRFIWGLEQVGRLLMLADGGEQGPPEEFTAPGVEKIRQAMLEFVSFVRGALEKELEAEEFRDFHYWDVLVAVVNSQASLQYRKDLESTISGVCLSIDRYFDVCFSEYPWRLQLLQFLKVASHYSYWLERPLARRLANKLEEHKGAMSGSEAAEVQVMEELLAGRPRTGKQVFDIPLLFEQVCGPCDQAQVKKWIDIVRQQESNSYPDMLELAAAVCGIKQFYERVEDTSGAYAPTAVVKTLLKALDCELSLETQTREQERYYVVPFTNYGVPLYDHIYNCIRKLAVELPCS